MDLLTKIDSIRTMEGVVAGNDHKVEYYIRRGTLYMGVHLDGPAKEGTIDVYLRGGGLMDEVPYALVGRVCWVGHPVAKGVLWLISYEEETWDEHARRTWNGK